MAKNTTYLSPGRGPSPAEREPLGLPVCDMCLTNDATNYCERHNKDFCDDCRCPECEPEDNEEE